MERVQHGYSQEVSILARPEGRALHGVNVSVVFSSEFQSSPAPKDGRYAHDTFLFRLSKSFNPRPPRRTGATRLGKTLAVRLNGFNPRPPRRTGATVRSQYVCFMVLVSILARPEGRALPQHQLTLCCLPVFQSSPAPKDGRYPSRRARLSRCRSFNPRPPRRTGATSTLPCIPLGFPLFQSSPAPKDGRYFRWIRSINAVHHVSILARPEGRALLHYLTRA